MDTKLYATIATTYLIPIQKYYIISVDYDTDWQYKVIIIIKCRLNRVGTRQNLEFIIKPTSDTIKLMQLVVFCVFNLTFDAASRCMFVVLVTTNRLTKNQVPIEKLCIQAILPGVPPLKLAASSQESKNFICLRAPENLPSSLAR